MNDMEKRISEELQKIRNELSDRVGILEKWRWVIIGGSIVVGFIITKLQFGLDIDHKFIYTLSHVY